MVDHDEIFKRIEHWREHGVISDGKKDFFNYKNFRMWLYRNGEAEIGFDNHLVTHGVHWILVDDKGVTVEDSNGDTQYTSNNNSIESINEALGVIQEILLLGDFVVFRGKPEASLDRS